MKPACQLPRPLVLGLVLASCGLTAGAATVLDVGHTDVGIAYDAMSNTWDLHVHDEENDVEYAPEDAILTLKPAAFGTVPAGSQWSFLGTAGSDLYTLPQTENPGLLFLGIGSEEILNGTFTGDQYRLSLKAVSGPGAFIAYDVDGFGEPQTVFFNSRDGISLADAPLLNSGGHQHLNWAFTAPGTYTVTFEASATRASDSLATSSGNIPYTFEVQPVPEPGTIALFAVGAAGASMLRRRR